MSVRYENHCVDCTSLGLHCIGSHCRNRKVEVHYCDNPKCNNELDEIYEVEGEEFCLDCLKEMFRKEF